MRFTYTEAMIDPSQYIPLARAADEAGYDGFAVPDSLCYPEHSDARYPYTESGDREFLDGKPFIEPFSLIPALAAVTERIRFTTFVVKLPIRHPVLVAKQAASVAVMSGDRFGFGVGLSPWPEDYTATGTEYRRRGARMDEMIEILRGLWTGEYFSYQGDFYDLPSLKICPVPDRPIPLLVGGHSDAALRRAARVGDGWMHGGGGEAADLEGALAKLAAYRAEAGRDHLPFEVHAISLEAFTPDGIRRLEDQGVTDVIVGFRNAYEPDTMPLQQKIDALRGFADNVLAKLG